MTSTCQQPKLLLRAQLPHLSMYKHIVSTMLPYVILAWSIIDYPIPNNLQTGNLSFITSFGKLFAGSWVGHTICYDQILTQNAIAKGHAPELLLGITYCFSSTLPGYMLLANVDFPKLMADQVARAGVHCVDQNQGANCSFQFLLMCTKLPLVSCCWLLNVVDSWPHGRFRLDRVVVKIRPPSSSAQFDDWWYWSFQNKIVWTEKLLDYIRPISLSAASCE